MTLMTTLPYATASQSYFLTFITSYYPILTLAFGCDS